MGSTKSARLRRELVRRLEEAGHIRTDAVREAFLAVPREVFIPEFAAKNRLDDVYKPQEAIPTRFDRDGMSISSSSAPTFIALNAPPDRLVMGSGLVDAKARSLAYLTVGRDGVKIRSAGGMWAEKSLVRISEMRKRRGKPSVDRLRIEAAYGGSSVVGKASVRGDCTLGFRWSKTAHPTSSAAG